MELPKVECVFDMSQSAYCLKPKGSHVGLSGDEIEEAARRCNSHKKLKTLLRDSTNILTGLMQEEQTVDTDCPTTFSHHTLQKLTRQRKANKQALKEAEKLHKRIVI